MPAFLSRLHVGRLAVVMTLVASVGVTWAISASAHVAYDGSGRFRHQSHSRNLFFWNTVTSDRWWQQTRDAQIHWDTVMQPALQFNTASSVASSTIHAVDGNYGQTGYIGFADGWGYHAGHGHMQLNDYYGRGQPDAYLQKVSCHEMGHFAGLAHSSDATDCMVSGSDFDSQLIGSSHAQQMRNTWNSTGH
jgi:hypothetical protein